MNYTGKYHLPQWEETDRIMRTDFNNAMAAIETGMAGNAGNAEDLRSRLLPMGRDAYRAAVQQRVHHGKGGMFDNMWINPLASLTDAGGGQGWNGRYGIHLGTVEPPTVEEILPTAKEESHIDTFWNTNNRSTKAAVTFFCGKYTTLESILVWSLAADASYSSKEFSFFITCTRVETGEVVDTVGPFTSQSNNTGRIPTLRTVNLPLEANFTYRLEFSLPDGTNYHGRTGFVLASTEYTGSQTPIFFAERSVPGALAQTVASPEVGDRARGIVRWRGDGSVKLLINGSELTTVRHRAGLDALGEPCVESEFQAETLPEEAFTLTLQMEQGEEDMEVLDYGLIWQ